MATRSRRVFEKLADLGTLVVPTDYKPANWFTDLCMRVDFPYYGLPADLSDDSFRLPTRTFSPGDRFEVEAWTPTEEYGGVAYDGCMTFLRGKKSALVGAQGLALVLEQMSDELPKGMLYTSLDVRSRLYEDDDRVICTLLVIVGGGESTFAEGLGLQLHAYEEFFRPGVHAILVFKEIVD